MMTEEKKAEMKEFEENLTPAEKSERRRILIACLSALFAINNLLLCAEAVLPNYIEQHHKSFITGSLSSIILA